jgi:rare lipoprotein A
MLLACRDLCYYGKVGRLAVLLVIFLPFYACGPKQVLVTPTRAPAAVSSSELEGIASYYAEPYHGRKTANGETFDTYQQLTAAHRTLPFNTMVRVTNMDNGRQVEVRINDRGPFIDGRVIDLSLRAARDIDMVRAGIAPVKLTILAGAVPSQPSYAVQVGAFENPRAAENLKQQLEKRYDRVRVQTFAAEKTFYRVRIGNEPDIQAAEKLASQLKKEDLQAFVVRVD